MLGERIGEDNGKVDVAGIDSPKGIGGLDLLEADLDARVCPLEARKRGRDERGTCRDERADAKCPAVETGKGA